VDHKEPTVKYKQSLSINKHNKQTHTMFRDIISFEGNACEEKILRHFTHLMKMTGMHKPEKK
jgi:hypothetical protein